MAGDRVSTTYLGQFTDANAERIAKGLTDAGIEFWTKQAGRYTRFFFIGEWGVRIFVDKARVAQAREIADLITGPST